uniref:Uncharacterized protein n=2 Tax=unclassified Caudoviricetes TaxID=2788787 RepID=A0A8S5MVN8_9CAUD|nr:MAG TPA: hypothetical protein [Siphoviridae sp. ctsBB38]DAF99146.1 MAG TPA: hypothetical protein [Siphoviridae sp. ctOxh11]DAG31207.1 MAG TPA: hypothetical protein [Caudoviricetes sp.]
MGFFLFFFKKVLHNYMGSSIIMLINKIDRGVGGYVRYKLW